MGQKVNPCGFRLVVNKNWESVWYSKGDYTTMLHEDLAVRKFVKDKLRQAGISRIEIKRKSDEVEVTVSAARPGLIIGKGGSEIESLTREISKFFDGKKVRINTDNSQRPDLSAILIAENIGAQIVKRLSYRRAMKRAIFNTMRAGAKGIKVMISGRVGGAEIARSEWSKEGRIPLHTLDADIDYGTHEALTTYGIIGIKVWVYKGNIKDKVLAQPAKKKPRRRKRYATTTKG